jgi:hypothetical protein
LITGVAEMPGRLSRLSPTERRGAGRCPKGIGVCRQLVLARLGGVSRAVDGGQAASEFLLTWVICEGYGTQDGKEK